MYRLKSPTVARASGPAANGNFQASGLSAKQLLDFIKSPNGAKSINLGWSPR